MKNFLPTTVIGLLGLTGIANVAQADDASARNTVDENAGTTPVIETSQGAAEAVEAAAATEGTPDPFASVQLSIDKSINLLAQKPTNPRAVLKQLSTAKAALSCPKDLIDARQVALIWVLEGYAFLLSGDDEDVQLAWDQAFTIYDEFDFTEQEISTLQLTDDVLNAFVQRRGMVMDRGVVDLYVPEHVGSAELFANGKKVSHGDAVYPGNQVIQIACPEDGLQSRWVTLEGLPEDTVDWFGFCPSGVKIDAAKDTAASDEMSLEDFGFGFGDTDPTKSYYNPSPICPAASSPNLANWILMGSGGALLASGAMSYGLWVVPAFENIKDGRANYQTITRAKADELTAAFQVAKGVTWSLLGAGTAALASGAALEYNGSFSSKTFGAIQLSSNGRSIRLFSKDSYGVGAQCGAWDIKAMDTR